MNTNNNQTCTTNYDDDFAALLDQVPVDFDACCEEIRPCKSFPKGAAILAKQNGRVTFALQVGKMTIDFASHQLDKDEMQAQAARYARKFEKGKIPTVVLNCLVR